MGRKQAEREARKKELEQQIEAYTQELVWEINWRLLVSGKTGISIEEAQELWKLLHDTGQERVWAELCMAGEMLWVEDVVLTAISYPKEHLGFAANLIRVLKRLFRYIGRLLKNKGRKGKATQIPFGNAKHYK